MQTKNKKQARDYYSLVKAENLKKNRKEARTPHQKLMRKGRDIAHASKGDGEFEIRIAAVEVMTAQ